VEARQARRAVLRQLLAIGARERERSRVVLDRILVAVRALAAFALK